MMALEATVSPSIDSGSVAEDSGTPAIEAKESVSDVPEQKTTSEKETSSISIESLALEIGWTPKKDFKGNPDDYIDAETYIRRSREIADSKNSQIGNLRRQLKDISSVVNELKTHNERVYKTEVKRLESELTALKAERRVAIADGDVDKVESIEQKITELHADATDTLNTAKKEDAPSPDVNSDWVSWKKGNSWYGDDEEMTEFADNFAKKYDGVEFKRVLRIVRDEVERVFPEKFKKDEKSDAKSAINPVEPGTRKVSGKTRFTKSDLTPSQRAIMGKFVRQGVMTEEAYIKDLATMGELS
jgi:hypothetical protein